MSEQAVVKPPVEGMSREESSAWRGFLRTHAILVRALDAELRAAHRLPLSEFEVLLWLSNREGGRMRLSDLAGSVLLTLSGVSRLVERLERRGLVRREPSLEDRRGAYAVLTDAGHVLVREARATHREGIHRHFLAHFSPDELSQLAAYWRRLLDEGPACDAGTGDGDRQASPEEGATGTSLPGDTSLPPGT